MYISTQLVFSRHNYSYLKNLNCYLGVSLVCILHCIYASEYIVVNLVNNKIYFLTSTERSRHWDVGEFVYKGVRDYVNGYCLNWLSKIYFAQGNEWDIKIIRYPRWPLTSLTSAWKELNHSVLNERHSVTVNYWEDPKLLTECSV